MGRLSGAALLLVLLLLPALALAHTAGRLDRYGCHEDARRGDYHCHRGEMRGMHFRSKADMLSQRRSGFASVPQGQHDAPAQEAPGERRGGIASWIPFLGSRWKRSPAPPAGATIVPRGIEERLRTLKRLYEEGLISEEEYAAKRREILGDL